MPLIAPMPGHAPGRTDAPIPGAASQADASAAMKAHQAAAKLPAPVKKLIDSHVGTYKQIAAGTAAEVRSGRQGLAAAREAARNAAAHIGGLVKEAAAMTTPPSRFARMVGAAKPAEARAKARAAHEGSGVQIAGLMRSLLAEQQVTNCAAEFERATRGDGPGGQKMPATAESLVGFHRAAVARGDEAARVWATRQLEGFAGPNRNSPAVAEALRTPDQFDPDLAERHYQAATRATPEELAKLLGDATAAGDASLLYALHRRAEEVAEEVDPGTGQPLDLPVWVGDLAVSLSDPFKVPDVVLTAVAGRERSAAAARSEAAQAYADHALRQIERAARLDGADPLTAEVLDRPLPAELPGMVYKPRY